MLNIDNLFIKGESGVCQSLDFWQSLKAFDRLRNLAVDFIIIDQNNDFSQNSDFLSNFDQLSTVFDGEDITFTVKCYEDIGLEFLKKTLKFK